MHQTESQPSRREFIRNSIIAGTGISAAGSMMENPALAAEHHSKSLIMSNHTVVFQGDSITDGRRDRRATESPNQLDKMGNGYVPMIASSLLVNYPDQHLKIWNRGVGGNKVYQLDERWDVDCLSLKPDVVSILIGVNDYWHTHTHDYEGTVQTYENDYQKLLKRTKSKLSTVKLVVCEPFLLNCGHVNDQWIEDFQAYRAVSKKVATEFNAKYVDFQSMFDEAVKYASPAFWAADGVHPSAHGASLMAKYWIKCVTG